jgi:probable F420-dependent oxidoreductase
MHFGVILPNYGESSTPAGIRRIAELAEELGFDSIWATEHIIVGPEAVDPYGRVYDPFGTLNWLAGLTDRIKLGTSIVLVPLHHPVRLAKEIATVQEFSEGRLLFGVGLGWHEDEFRFMRYEFAGRGARADEALRVMDSLWRGERTFQEGQWEFREATFAPLPEPVPELWIAGGSARAVRRALEAGDVWHPTRIDPADIRRVKQEHPALRTIPRVHADELDRVDDFLDTGVEGAVVTFPGEDEMRAFAQRYR